MDDRNVRFCAAWLLNSIVNGLYEPSVLMKEFREMAGRPEVSDRFREGSPEEQDFFRRELQNGMEELLKAQQEIEAAIRAAGSLLGPEPAAAEKEVHDE